MRTSDLRATLEHLRGVLPPTVATTALVDVPADRPPWTATGLHVAQGDRVTTFAGGQATVAGITLGPAFQLWSRVGSDGAVARGTRATNTWTAVSRGELELCSYFPGEWASPKGELAVDPAAYAGATGGFTVLAVRWAAGVDPARHLAVLDDPSGLVATELDRLGGVHAPPPPWRYLWLLGDSEIFTPGAGRTIDCHTREDVGILQHDVDVPLTAGTRLQWSWRVDELPSKVAEDTLPTHDYMSIALEFENGQDLTWYWSAALPVGHSYRCPIPTWYDRETHMVVRSGADNLGTWLHEDRPVHEDYAAAIGTPPTRIVRVWLIALTLFQRRQGRSSFGDIRLTDGDRTLAL